MRAPAATVQGDEVIARAVDAAVRATIETYLSQTVPTIHYAPVRELDLANRRVVVDLFGQSEFQLRLPYVGVVPAIGDQVQVTLLRGGKSFAQAAAVDVSAGGGMPNPMTTIGDLIVGGTGGAPTRLGVGTDGQVLTVQPDLTLAWEAAGAAIDWAEDADITTQAFGDAAAANAGTEAAPAGHRHGMPANPVTAHEAAATAHAASTNLEKTANKGVASGYASLSAAAKLVQLHASPGWRYVPFTNATHIAVLVGATRTSDLTVTNTAELTDLPTNCKAVWVQLTASHSAAATDAFVTAYGFDDIAVGAAATSAGPVRVGTSGGASQAFAAGIATTAGTNSRQFKYAVRVVTAGTVTYTIRVFGYWVEES